ncbi:MAG: 1-acyl-sn-glycerol-3-phosphate acyltransferase [Lentimicrobium sp.]|jgi:1-acyl-sn-glycerol-3-phosphate acyltransferase|nr:1-acyl-sn-glycerol-3-phosphate acyltransferase [Lentimicrobium sp.]
MKKTSPSIVPRNIARTSPGYLLLCVVADFFFRLFYRRFIVLNRQLVPQGEQLIYASNHQNALMDALAMLFAARKPVAFLARADMFKKPFIAHLLHFLKIMPIFRPRDGMENMNANYEVFQATARLLKTGMPIALLPEGTHSPIKKLQQLKKGVCRIAFQAAEAQNFEADIYIVPTGIDFTSYSKAGTDLLLIYGPPINIAQYYPLYRENPQKAIYALIQHLADEIKKLMIHVEDEDYYTTIQQVITLFASDDKRYANFLKARKIIRELHESPDKAVRMNALTEFTTSYMQLLKEGGFRDKNVRQPVPFPALLLRLILAVLALPLALTGGVINYLPYKLPTLISNKVKDKQFVSSVNYGVGLVCFVLWYLILAIVVVVSFKSVLALLLLPLAAGLGLFAFYYYIALKKLRGGFNFFRFRRHKPAQYHRLLQIRDAIIALVPTENLKRA